MEDRLSLLMKSSENISRMLTLMELHEENIRNQGSVEVDIQLINLLAPRRALDVSYSVFDISSVAHLITSGQYMSINNPINTTCPITHDLFLPTDNVIMINECRHTFKRNSLIRWLNRHQTCPCCRTTLP
jgi:hypothetical protein